MMNHPTASRYGGQPWSHLPSVAGFQPLVANAGPAYPVRHQVTARQRQPMIRPIAPHDSSPKHCQKCGDGSADLKAGLRETKAVGERILVELEKVLNEIKILGQELEGLKSDVIFQSSTVATQAAKDYLAVKSEARREGTVSKARRHCTHAASKSRGPTGHRPITRSLGQAQKARRRRPMKE